MVDSKDSCACTYLIPVHTGKTSARKKKSFSGGYLMPFDFTLVKQTQEKKVAFLMVLSFTPAHMQFLLCLTLSYACAYCTSLNH